MHMANHPDCKHYCENIYDVDPEEVCEGRCIAGAWFSPDCTHHSRARGSKPVKKEIRGLAQSIIRWADMDRERRPRVIYVENVSEFQDWGPTIAYCKQHKTFELVEDACPTCGGRDSIEMPDKARKGETFRLWVAKLEELGYVVEWRELTASDYGAPTTRKRLFVIARCDGRPIVWPEPTHAKPEKIEKEIKAKGSSKLVPWRTAAEIIDWSIECPSIFLSPEEAKAAGCRRPLAEKTLARIAKGIERYVIDTPNPFIVSYYGPKAGDESSNHRGRSIDDPLPTVTTENRFAVVSPYLMSLQHKGATRGPLEPARTITASDGDCNLLVSACLASTANQGTTGRAPYCWPVEEPFRTLTATGDKVVVSASISRMFGASVGTDCESPIGTTTAENKSALVTAFLAKH
jgi:DNA (cytosine-5)-methyltransferase 1